MTLHRRRVLQGGAGALAVAGIGGIGRAGAQGATLRAMHFGGPYAAFSDLIARPFEQAGHGKVTYAADTTPGAYAKLEADPRNPPYDVFMSVRTLSVRYAGSGLLAKLDPAQIPSLADVVPDAVVPGGTGVALVLEYFDLMYDKSKVRTPLDSWLDLWRPEFRGKIALHSSTTVTPLYLIAVYTRAIGGNERDPKAVDEAFAKYRDLKAGVRVFTTDPVQVNTMMDRGEIDIGVQFGIRISALRATNPNVARVTPKEGVPAIPLDLVVPQNTPQLALAHKYLDFVLSRERQNAIARTLVATPSNRNVAMDDELKSKILSDYSKLIYFDEAYLGSVREAWLNRWKNEVQS